MPKLVHGSGRKARGLSLIWSGFPGRLQVTRVGDAIDLDRTGNVVELDSSLQVDLRASHRIATFRGQHFFLTAAADNVTDATVTPQFGLPLPGRTIRLGIRVE